MTRSAIRLSLLCLSALRVAAGQPAGFERIDAHVHIYRTDPSYRDLLRRMSLRVLNICVVDKYDRGFEEAEPQHRVAREVFRITQGRAAWCSTFDPQDWEQPRFGARAVASLEDTFRQGAVAVKIYKSIGMDLKSRDGRYVMPDDPVFDPIFAAIARSNRTVFAHIAEPWAAWRPLDPASPHYSYYKENPDWHMLNHPERPSKEKILEARDHMLKKNPGLRVVGCHLGSMEDNVAEIAKRFDLYPNFAVDTAARIPDLMLQDREKVRGFFIKYQDRVVYGTDLSMMPWSKPEDAIGHMEQEYARDWKFLATNESLRYNDRTVRGLALPLPVLRKIFFENAARWVPGLAP